MGILNISELDTGQCFTADSYIFDGLFFLPKNSMIKDYHVQLLKEWEVKEIITDGNLIFFTKGENQQEKSQEESNTMDDDLESLFDNADNLISDETTEGDASTWVQAPTSQVKSTEEIYKIWLRKIKDFFENIISNKTINKDSVVNLLAEIEKYTKQDKTSLLKLFGEPIDDIPRLYRQTLETVILSFLMSNSLELSEFSKTNLTIATLFHDIGMLKIPRGILSKNVPLTGEEINLIRNHTTFGYKYLRAVNYSAIIASGALQHHEKINGTGYPNSLNAEKITQVGKIIGIIDAYSAAISNKTFKSSIHAKEAVQDLLGKSGTFYEPELLRAFIKNISFYPIGCLVLLSTGKPAKVVGETNISMKPIVIEIINGKAGETINLSERQDIYIKGIYSTKRK